MSRPLIAPLLLALAVALPHTAMGAEKIYRWTDERGRVIISDRPPEDSSIPHETVDMGSSGLRRKPASPPKAPLPAEQDTEGTPGPSRAAETESKEALPKDPRICAAARNNLESLEGLARVRMMGEDGEFYFLTEQQKEEEREQARRLIELHCD